MACSLKSGLHIGGSNGVLVKPRAKGFSGFCAPSCSFQYRESKYKDFPRLRMGFPRKPVFVLDQKGLRDSFVKAPTPSNFSVRAQASICVSRALRWWEKTLKPNMIEIHSAQELVDSLLNAGDRLVIVDFYSPGCGGCRTLHPKICQLAESNPDAIFLEVNYEELRTMCQTLHIHVLPFFRIYRGAEGRLCSFSCTNATIKKFKDALAKYGKDLDRCSLGPPKGLDEAELMRLASTGEISKILPLPSTKQDRMADLVMSSIDISGIWSNIGDKMQLEAEKAVVKV